MTRPVAVPHPVIITAAGPVQGVTVGVMRRTYRGGPGLALVVWDMADAYYLIDQLPDGALHLRHGPITLTDAMDAASRVLAGREHSITADADCAAMGCILGLSGWGSAAAQGVQP